MLIFNYVNTVDGVVQIPVPPRGSQITISCDLGPDYETCVTVTRGLAGRRAWRRYILKKPWRWRLECRGYKSKGRS